MGLRKPLYVLWREPKANILGDGFEPGGSGQCGSPVTAAFMSGKKDEVRKFVIKQGGS